MKVLKFSLLIFCVLGFTGLMAASEKTLDKAYRLLKAKDYKGAVHLFEIHLEANPSDALIHLEAAYVYIKMKQDSSALPHLLKHMELVPAKPEVLLETAYACLRTMQLKEAETFLTRYLEARPLHIDVHAELAFLLLRNGKRKAAIQRMRFILEREPDREMIRLNLAYILLEKQPGEAYRHFRILARSKDPDTRQRAQAALKNKPANIGYFLYANLYHSFRFDINVLDINSKVYLKDSFIAPLEPYLFLILSTDAESTINPFPTIYSEQAVIAGLGLQWYFFKRNARLFLQYGYRTRFLKLPQVRDKKGSLSYGADSFFYVPLGKQGGLELYNSLVYHSRFDNDFIFEGKEIIIRRYPTGAYGFFKPYAGIMLRWDSKKYFYNNSYELLAGMRWSRRSDFTYYLYCEYKRGNYLKNTPYGRYYNEFIVGIVVGIYR